MMTVTSRLRSQQNVPENVEDWLAKWEPKLNGLKKRRGKTVAAKASGALDELEFLLARIVENQVSE
jgi:hypothetical protein